MSRGYVRPIRKVLTGVSTIYVPINRQAEKLTIQADSGGSTFSVAYTNDNIVRSQANSYDVHGETLVPAASAFYTDLIASAAVDAEFKGDLQAMAIRIDLTVYVADLVVFIQQAK